MNGETLWLGNRRLMDENGVDTAAFDAAAAEQEAAGRTVSWLARASDRRALGLLAFGDAVKASAAAGVARLQAKGVRTVMLTGDNRGAAQTAAAALGIDSVLAEVLPADKAAHVGQLKTAGVTVAMVGDGINDAPALAAADVGIAMSTGTDVAMHTAGITLMRGDPALVADAIDISQTHLRQDPAEPVLGLRLQRGRHPAGGARLPQPGDRRRGDGVLQRQRGDECADAQALAAGSE